VQPGVVWGPQWRPEPEDTDFNDNAELPIGLCGVIHKP
jgi:hypothetical protein